MTVRFNEAEIRARVVQGVRQGIVAVTEGVRNEAISLILTGPKTGRIYRRRGVEHQASAAGEAPASDTGRLVGSVRTRYEDDYMTGIVAASTAYAEALEFGTVKMEPRPFMRVALARKRADIEPTIDKFVRAALA